MPTAELTSTRRARQAAAIPEGARLRGQRGRGRAAVHATRRWLLHALAELARSWALAAGIPPDQYP